MSSLQGNLTSPVLSQKIHDASESVECGCCSVTFGQDAKNPRFARLTVKSTPQSVVEDGVQTLTGALERVLNSRIDFVAAYDFRDYKTPEVRFVKTLAEWCVEHKAEWERGLKFMAMLIKEDIWGSMAKALIGTFIKMCPPHCPYIICHSEEAAEQFFLTHLGTSPGLRRAKDSHLSTSSFVSIEDIMEVQRCPPQKPLKHDGPLSKYPDLGHSVHLRELSNGDVQVIQSGTSLDSNIGSRLEFFSSKSFDNVTVASFVSISSLSSSHALLHRCSQSALQQFPGAHFDFDELMFDAYENPEEQHDMIPCFHSPAEQVADMWKRVSYALSPGCSCISRQRGD